MLKKVPKGYSFLIRPLIILFDLVILCICTYIFIKQPNNPFIYIYVSVGWLLVALWINFYQVYRFTQITKILGLLIQQGFLLSLIVYSYFGIAKNRSSNNTEIILFISLAISCIAFFKIGIYYLLKRYRLYLGGNNRHILVFGNNEQTNELLNYFKTNPSLGYRVDGIFNNKSIENIDSGITFLKNNRIDEVYCSIEQTPNKKINEIVSYCETYGVVLKFIPDIEKMPVTNLSTDYYDYIPLLSIPKKPLHSTENILLKRILDIILSLFVIVGILSWLCPLLYILFKIEGKGSLFFIHERNGLSYKTFKCYKFRSLSEEGDSNRLHVSEKDERITKIGGFLRRTSIDELPQFYNVLKGDMSIVGPRPHIPRYTEEYSKKIDKYQFVFRHSARPGITGLAQVKGYRGEIKSDDDIINRIKFDIFYIENWSLLLDAKIMISTLIMLVKGEQKAS